MSARFKKWYINFYSKFNNFIDSVIKIVMYINSCFLLSLPFLFFYLNSVQFSYFVDEKFHIPQTLKYCEGKFFEWDPKITTLPGLYIFSALLLGPVGLCNIIYLRSINVICIYLNFLMTWKIVDISNKKAKDLPESYHTDLTAWNITFLPPLFFFFFLYYTDIFSVSLILIMLLFHHQNKSIMSAFFGALSVCVRQTNIVWVGLVAIERTLILIDEITKKPQLINSLNLLPCMKTLFLILNAKAHQGTTFFFNYLIYVFKPLVGYLTVGITFIIFLIYNKGIVIGDRNAHTPTIHLTQIFYYSVFVFGFSWPYLIIYFRDFLKFIIKNIIKSILLLVLIGLIVHFNTLVHPYLLADNRHFLFYVWKNFMIRYVYFKYTMIPIYAFTIFAIFKSLKHVRLWSLIAYLLCTVVVIVPQLLLEVRYFFIPYILFRLHQKEAKTWQLIAENCTTYFLIFLQFYVFVNKSFTWNDEEYPQRIGW